MLAFAASHCGEMNELLVYAMGGYLALRLMGRYRKVSLQGERFNCVLFGLSNMFPCAIAQV